MSPTPEPQLLSPEQLASIQSAVKRSGTVHESTLADFYREDVPALLADRAAFRQMVAAEMQKLLYGPDVLAQLEPADQVSCMLRNNEIRRAASRLGLELPS